MALNLSLDDFRHEITTLRVSNSVAYGRVCNNINLRYPSMVFPPQAIEPQDAFNVLQAFKDHFGSELDGQPGETNSLIELYTAGPVTPG